MTESELNQLMINAGAAVNEKVSKDLYSIIRLIIVSFFLMSGLLIIIFTLINFNISKQEVIYKDIVKYKIKNNIDFINNEHLIKVNIKGNQKCYYYRKSSIISEFYTICK